MIAWIIDPDAFKNRETLANYCIGQGDSAEVAHEYAEQTHGPDCAAALAKAAAILTTLASRTPEGMVMETWATINQWCDDTFGPATVPQIIARAKEEFDELETPDADHAIEAADVVICLCRIPGFADALQRKMAINRKRKWRLTGEGTGYHIPQPTPSGAE